MTKIIFTPTNPISKLYPPTPVKNTLPEWYKKMGSYVENQKLSAMTLARTGGSTAYTGKRCVPLLDYMTCGYTISIPCDVAVDTVMDGDTFSYVFSIPNNNIPPVVGHHNHNQFPIKIDGLKRHYIKFFLGWRITTPAGYSSLLYPSFFNFEDRFTLLPAIVDTDTHDAVLGSIGYFNGSKPSSFIIQAGTPLLTVFPFKRDEWVSVIDEEVFDVDKSSKLLQRMKTQFGNAYRNFFHAKKSYE